MDPGVQSLMIYHIRLTPGSMVRFPVNPLSKISFIYAAYSWGQIFNDKLTLMISSESVNFDVNVNFDVETLNIAHF